MDWLGVSDAAAELGVSAQRVRQLINEGDLEAHQISGRWLIDQRSLDRVAHSKRLAGRPWAPARAWALLLLADGREPGWLSDGELRRLRDVLAHRGLDEMVGQLRQRADRRNWYIHPGLLDDFLAEPGVIVSGARASGRLRDSGPVDVYVVPDVVDQLIDRYVPDEHADAPNLIVRVVRGPWPFAPGERQAWPAVAAIDLLERADDSRARRVAQELLADA